MRVPERARAREQRLVTRARRLLLFSDYGDYAVYGYGTFLHGNV